VDASRPSVTTPMLRRRPSRSSLLCHGDDRRVQSKRAAAPTPWTRRSSEKLPPVQPALRDLCRVRSWPCVLLTGVSGGGAPGLPARGAAPASRQPRRPVGSPRSPARLSRPREGSLFPPSVAGRHTVRGHADGAERTPGGCGALYGLWPRKRVAPSTALADPSRVLGDTV